MGYSIFLSHTETDRDFVRKLDSDLRAAGARVWFAEAEIKVGDSLIKKIEKGIEETDYLGVVLSPNSVASEWVQREVNIALTKEIKGKRVTVLPILYKKCEMPAFLIDKLHADFTNESNYLNALNLILETLELKSKRVQAELFVKTCVEAMGFKYSQISALPSIHGIIQLPKRQQRRIAVHIRTDRKTKEASPAGRESVSVHLDRNNVLKWRTLGLPVIVVWVNFPDDSKSDAYGLWRSAGYASSSGRLRIPTREVFGSRVTAKRLKRLTKFAWQPNLRSLSKRTLFHNKVSEVKEQAWNFYASWRNSGSRSPIFGRVEITLKGWRHLTRVSTKQKAIIHKLSLLPLAKELVETAQKSKCVRTVETDFVRRELHALRGVYTSADQADMLVEVILEVDFRRRARFLSVQERRGWTDL